MKRAPLNKRFIVFVRNRFQRSFHVHIHYQVIKCCDPSQYIQLRLFLYPHEFSNLIGRITLVIFNFNCPQKLLLLTIHATMALHAKGDIIIFFGSILYSYWYQFVINCQFYFKLNLSVVIVCAYIITDDIYCDGAYFNMAFR